MMKKDEEGHLIITVKDLKDFLSLYPDDMQVAPDKDGWMEDEILPTLPPNTSPIEYIKHRGLFESFRNETLFINN